MANPVSGDVKKYHGNQSAQSPQTLNAFISVRFGERSVYAKTYVYSPIQPLDSCLLPKDIAVPLPRLTILNPIIEMQTPM